MAAVRLLVELDVDAEDDGGAGSQNTTESDLEYAAHEAVVEALEFVQSERGFWNPIKGTDIKVYGVSLVDSGSVV